MALLNPSGAATAGDRAAKPAARPLRAPAARETLHADDGLVPEAIIAKVRAQSRFDQRGKFHGLVRHFHRLL